MEWNQMCLHTHMPRIRESSGRAGQTETERERDVCVQEQIHVIPLGFSISLS